MIDRKKVVARHHPVMTGVNPLSPLSVGNGEFAFTADITGLQTFPESYDMPLGTQSQWGWHYTGSSDRFTLRDVAMQSFESHGRSVRYPLYEEGKEEAYHWLRQNPHRLQLGRISFRLWKENGEAAAAKDIRSIRQTLNLWEGILYSEFQLEGSPVTVETVCHPQFDQLGVHVSSPLIKSGRLQVFMRFPAPDMSSESWWKTIHPDWGNDGRHQTICQEKDRQSAVLRREMDRDRYEVGWSWTAGHLKRTAVHEYTLYPAAQAELSFSVAFARESAQPLDFTEIKSASQKHWAWFWQTGGAVDFSQSLDPRAEELERRVVLSQFLTAIHSAGLLPPQETGLIYNSWFGKFHLEMHWWHAAHFPLWGRADLLAKSLDWYVKILPVAKELARSQGYEGARWPKMVGYDAKQTPSPIAPALIWQQPHPIALAELCYRARPDQDTLMRWKEIVFESARFMASFAAWDERRKAYVLGPPLIPAQECHLPEESWNPPYELEYWKYGLEIAVRWAKRLGESVPAKWKEVAASMAKPPHAEGVYLAHENCPDTFSRYNHDHPSMVGALGILPGSLIDAAIMKQTLQRVRTDWQWKTAWGWDFPMCAMTAARLGEGSLAVDFLLMDAEKNTYLPNGHNYQSASLMAYLPGNGGLLTAVAMMAAGWQGGPAASNPGFPGDGSWSVEWEGLFPLC